MVWVAGAAYLVFADVMRALRLLYHRAAPCGRLLIQKLANNLTNEIIKFGLVLF